MKPARPSKLSEEDRSRIMIMAGYGMDRKDMAGVLGIDPSILEHEFKFGDLSNLIQKGRARGVFQIKQAAFEMAKNGENPQMTMFWLKQVEGWENLKREEFSKLKLVKQKKK